MSSTENRPDEAPAPAEPSSLVSPSGNRKVMVQGFNALFNVHKLLTDAPAAGIEARFFFGKRKSGYRRNIYIVSKSETGMEEAKKFLVEWYKANPPPPAPKKASKGTTPSEPAETPTGTSTGTSAEASAETSKETSKETSTETAEKPAETPAESAASKEPFEPIITFTDLPPTTKTRKRSTRKDATKATAGSSAAATDSEKTDELAAAAAVGDAASGSAEKPQAKRAPRRRRQRSKANKEGSAEDFAAESPGTTPGSTPESTATTPVSVQSAAGASAAGKTKGKETRRSAPPKYAPQPGRVAVRVPNETTMEEVEALRPPFESTEIVLKHQEARTTYRSGRRLFLQEVTLALIDVGEANQAKAIEALKGKEIRGAVLDPKPGRERIHDEAPAAPEPQHETQVEHVESKSA